MKSFRGQNLAKDAYNNEENARVLRRLESVEIKDGKVTLKSKAKKEKTAEPSKAETPAAGELPSNPFARDEAPAEPSPKVVPVSVP